MKKLFEKLIGRSGYYHVAVIVLLCCLQSIKTVASCPNGATYIQGSSSVFVNNQGSANTYYICSAPNGTNHVWSANITPSTHASAVVQPYSAPLGNQCSLAFSYSITTTAITNCTILLHVDYDIDDGNGNIIGNDCAEMTILVMPYIDQAPLSLMHLYPGDLFTVSLSGNCANSPPPGYSLTYNWSTQPSNYCSSCTSNLNSFQVMVPTNPAALTGFGLTVNCTIAGTGIAGSGQALAPVVIPLAMHIPVISGPTCIGCSDCEIQGDELQFTCSSVLGAGAYFWQVFSNSTPSPSPQIVLGQGTSAITVKVSHPGTFIVRVAGTNQFPNATFNSPFSPGTVVNVCCIPNVTVSNNVNTATTDDEQAGLEVLATNNVYAGATAIYHGGNDVRLDPGFAAWPDSYFHAYTDPCNGTYYRTAHYSDTLNAPPADSARTVSVDHAADVVTNNYPQIETAQHVVVAPNPNNGNFTITSKSRLTGKIVITSELGVLVYEKDIKNSLKTNLDLSGTKGGVYILRIVGADKTISPVKLVIDN